jgi:hypothetical protein
MSGQKQKTVQNTTTHAPVYDEIKYKKAQEVCNHANNEKYFAASMAHRRCIRQKRKQIGKEKHVAAKTNNKRREKSWRARQFQPICSV